MQISSLLNRLPPYPFDRVYEEVKKADKAGATLINLAAGVPDLPPPAHVREALLTAICQEDVHQYPPTAGEEVYLESIAAYYRRRFNVILDPAEEIIALHGSKEGMARLALAVINPGDLAVVPDPAYPGFASAISFSGGQVQPVPLLEANSFLPDLESICSGLRKSKPSLMFLNYPNVPTGVVAPREFFSDLVRFAIQEQVVLCNDAAYSEIYCSSVPPSSILEAPGAMDIAVELGTLSNTYQLPGWRIGYAVGNRNIIRALRQVEAHLDSGVFRAIQRAAAVALSGPQQFVEGLRKVYRQRRDVVLRALAGMGLEPIPPEATCYVWVKLPRSFKAAETFCRILLDRSALLLLPGSYLGAHGEGYFRISLTAPEEVLGEAMKRMRGVLEDLAAD